MDNLWAACAQFVGYFSGCVFFVRFKADVLGCFWVPQKHRYFGVWQSRLIQTCTPVIHIVTIALLGISFMSAYAILICCAVAIRGFGVV